ncbi:hypothetical protein ACF0H5_015368 [Mactra antiquata]
MGLLCVSIMWILLVSVAQYSVLAEQCPEKSSLSCRDEGIPCPNRSVRYAKMTFFKLEDGTECAACQQCFAAIDVCPSMACWIREFPRNCKTVNIYSTYVKTLAGNCDLCDVYSCSN